MLGRGDPDASSAELDSIAGALEAAGVEAPDLRAALRAAAVEARLARPDYGAVMAFPSCPAAPAAAPARLYYAPDGGGVPPAGRCKLA